MKLSDMGVVELQQRRHAILESLVEANKDKADEAGRIAARGLEAELADVSAELDKREGRLTEQKEAVRRTMNPAEYESGAMLTPKQSVRSFLQDNGLIKQPEFEKLQLGALLRSMVTGPKNELERRVLGEASDSTGGISVPDITLARFVDKLRAAMVCIQAGAQTVPLTSDKTTIARTATDPVAGWRSENATVDTSDATFEGIVLIPRSLAVLVKASRELISDSVNIEQALEASLRGALAVELDRVALRGSGTPPEPLGIKFTSGVNHHVTIAGPFASYDDLIEAMLLNWQDNETVTSAIVMSPLNVATLAQLKEGTTNAPLRRPPVLENIPILMTNSMDNDSCILGDFSKLIIGVRMSLRIEVLRELYAENLQYAFLAHLRADIAVEHPESFAWISNLTGS